MYDIKSDSESKVESVSLTSAAAAAAAASSSSSLAFWWCVVGPSTLDEVEAIRSLMRVLSVS